MFPNTIHDRHRSTVEFLDLLNERKSKSQLDPLLCTAFVQERRRFLPDHVVMETVDNEDLDILSHPALGQSWESMVIENLLRELSAMGVSF